MSTTRQPRRGIMFVISSPSGAGKTTLTRNLVNADRNLDLSISVTTRPRRPSEVDGVHYHFISTREFERMRRSGDLLEYAKVHGNYYGTPRRPVEKALAAGRDILFDIDWQGAKQLYEKMRTDVVSIFVLPPSARELKARLERRAEDSDEVIARRLRNAAQEILHWTEYDHLVVNRDLNEAFSELRHILRSERAKRRQRRKFLKATEKLLADLKKITC
ncbi:MAG TPA: guanylate kinase [Pseudorhodoplanes sp.]|jgi:guanylate kinase|nr:guanylate kinase [Pseudorhodoplanes sp.]